MPIAYNAADVKERIVSFIKDKGPTLPVHVARALRIEPLFTGAFLSELYRENRIFMSHMKIGSSSLYLLSGQEAQLENFIEHLNQRERESFLLLQKEKVLIDDQQSPVTRVSLRAIKDFAVPFKVGEGQRLAWRYHLFPEDQAFQAVENRMKGISITTPITSQVQTVQATPQTIESLPVQIIKQEPITPIEEKNENKKVEEKVKIERKPKKKGEKEEESKFQQKVKDHINSSSMEIIQLFIDKKKEMMGKVKVKDAFGSQEYFFVAKDKKKVSPEDLSSTREKAHAEKMPALFISPGELDKKAIEYMKEWNNLIKHQTIK